MYNFVEVQLFGDVDFNGETCGIVDKEINDWGDDSSDDNDSNQPEDEDTEDTDDSD